MSCCFGGGQDAGHKVACLFGISGQMLEMSEKLLAQPAAADKVFSVHFFRVPAEEQGAVDHLVATHPDRARSYDHAEAQHRFLFHCASRSADASLLSARDFLAGKNRSRFARLLPFSNASQPIPHAGVKALVVFGPGASWFHALLPSSPSSLRKCTVPTHKQTKSKRDFCSM